MTRRTGTPLYNSPRPLMDSSNNIFPKYKNPPSFCDYCNFYYYRLVKTCNRGTVRERNDNNHNGVNKSIVETSSVGKIGVKCQPR